MTPENVKFFGAMNLAASVHLLCEVDTTLLVRIELEVEVVKLHICTNGQCR